MRRKHGDRGFTMAELLIVVAIIGVLAGVSFVAVQRHQKSLSQSEVDSIAKEIFVAAQNHLTLAQSQNYLGLQDDEENENIVFGEKDTTDNSIRYFTVNAGKVTSSASQVFEEILPFGSVDETVRSGNYLIRYQPDSALVLDVFYCSPNGRYKGTLDVDDYSTILGLAGDDNRSARGDYSGAVVGWYGESAAAKIQEGKWLEQPQIEIENAEKLQVKVTDTNIDNSDSGFIFQLIISGLDFDGNETGAKKAITIRKNGGLTDSEYYPDGVNAGVYTVILDDITYYDGSGKYLHFAGLHSDTSIDFVPGQDISIQAVVYNGSLISNIAYSDLEVTNSLFGRIDRDDSGVVTASINNVRHLENLDEDISGLDTTTIIGTGTDTINLQKAIQTSDISWTIFKGNTKGNDTIIYRFADSSPSTLKDCFIPVSPEYGLSYKGQKFNISDIHIAYGADAGLFNSIGNEDTSASISDLALLDFNVSTTSGNAGALAGSMTNATVTNVVAYNTGTGKTATITGTGSVGGLIGEATGCTIRKSAAALVVSSSAGSAGGLIGTSSGGTVTASYSGGHTDSAEYYTGGDRTKPIYNVNGSTNAGGLIGEAGDTTITQCYSTCSATGATVGGLVGTSSGSISQSYCTGLVSGSTAQGAFAGELGTGATATSCQYFEIVNEIPDTTNGGFKYLTAIGGDGENDNISPFDKDAATYDAFSWPGGGDCPWKDATVYDKTLITYYGKTDEREDRDDRTARYNLETVEQLGFTVYREDQKDADGNITAYADFVIQHYGDWPAPEIFVVNTQTN